MRRTPTACAALLLAWGVTPPAWAVEDFQLEFQPATIPDTYSIQVNAVLDAPPLAVRHTLLHICDFRETTAFLRDCIVFNIQENRAWSYAYVDPPVLDPRDYVSLRTVENDLAQDGTGVLRMRYRQDHTAGPAPREGAIRVQVNEGHWEIRPGSAAGKTALTYSLTLNPGGRVPLWMARLAARRAAPEQVRRIEHVAQEQQKKGAVVLPEPQRPWADVKVRPLPGAAITGREK